MKKIEINEMLNTCIKFGDVHVSFYFLSKFLAYLEEMIINYFFAFFNNLFLFEKNNVCDELFFLKLINIFLKISF